MKIAFINQPTDTGVVPVRYGLSAIFTYQAARRLARSFDVIVYARKSHMQKKVEWIQRVQYRRVPVFKRPYFTSTWHDLGYALEIANDLRMQQCEIVHIQNYSQFIPIIRAFNPTIKIVLHIHNDLLTQLDKVLVEQRLRKANLVISCSEYITNKLRISFPKIASRCHTINNGVDIDYFVSNNDPNNSQKNEAKRLLFVGRVSPEKGVDVLLDAFNKVVGCHPEAQLKIVGPQSLPSIESAVAMSNDSKSDLESFYSGTYFSELLDRLSSSVVNQVTFTGNVLQSQLLSHYQNADVFILPSVWDEPFGMTLIEAMAVGVPVVATQVGGVKEIVKEGKTGLLVERGDASALAEAIVHLLSDEELRKATGQAGRQRVVQLFSWERIVENLLYHYKNIC